MEELSIVGDIINFRGTVYAPTNEQGVIFLFGKVSEDLGIIIEEVKSSCPDCIARRFVGKGWKRIRIEFEFKSKNFVLHNHDIDKCDLIICWENNWPGCPIEVLELKTEIKNLKNFNIHVSSNTSSDDIFVQINHYFHSNKSKEHVKQKFLKLYDEMQKINDEIWIKVSNKNIGIYSSTRSFASAKVFKKGIRFYCFSRGNDINGTTNLSWKSCPRWRAFLFDENYDVSKAFSILKESYHLHNSAITAGENTSWLSAV